jgi:hypothetical protein
MTEFGRLLFRAWALKLAGWLQRVAGSLADPAATADAHAASSDVSAPSDAPRPDGPPPHWVEKVRRAAPHLLRPGPPTFAAPAGPAVDQPPRLPRPSLPRVESKPVPAAGAGSGSRPVGQRQTPMRRRRSSDPSFLKFRTDAPRTVVPAPRLEQQFDHSRKANPAPTFPPGRASASANPPSFTPPPERSPSIPADPKHSPPILLETKTAPAEFHEIADYRIESDSASGAGVADPVGPRCEDPPLRDTLTADPPSPHPRHHPEGADSSWRRVEATLHRTASPRDAGEPRPRLAEPAAPPTPPRADPRSVRFPEPPARGRDDSPAIENRDMAQHWAELPDAARHDPWDQWLDRVRENEHLARLDREQRGVLWIA